MMAQTATREQLAPVRDVSTVAGWRVLGFHGRYYLAPPTPHAAAVELDRLRLRFAAIAAGSAEQTEVIAEYAVTLAAAVELMKTLVRPLRWRNRGIAGLWARLTWRWRRNPFRNATDADIRALFDFFDAGRKASSVEELPRPVRR